MQNVDALLPEDTVNIKILDAKRSSDLAGTVIPDARRAQTEAGVRDVELMAIAPRTALLHVQTLKADVSGAELPLDEVRDGAVLDKFGQHEALPPKARGNVQHVRLCARRLHIKRIAVLHRHPIFRRDAHAHARGTRKGVAFHFFYSHNRFAFPAYRYFRNILFDDAFLHDIFVLSVFISDAILASGLSMTTIIAIFNNTAECFNH